MRLVTTAATLFAFASIPARSASSLEFEDLLGLPECPEPMPWHPLACQWEPRPDADEWLSLLVPIQTLIGTAGDDALAAGAEGDVVRGLAGDDGLASAFNRTALLGSGGDDELITDLAAGSRIVFAGRGTGEIASWEEILPPDSQVRWTRSEKVERVAPALSVRAAAPDFDPLPRDH